MESARYDTLIEKPAPWSVHPAHTADATQAVQVPHDAGSVRSSLEQLAQKWHCPSDEVEELYCSEYQLLQCEARIDAYIPVLAMKRVRDVLRNRRAVN